MPDSTFAAGGTLPVTEAAKEPVLEKKDIRFSILDFSGSPIPYGHVVINGTRCAFANGAFRHAPLAMNDIPVVIEADQYISSSTRIAYPTQTEGIVYLEYLCDYRIQVKNTRQEPVEGAEILLWKEKTAARPVAETIAILPFTSRMEKQSLALRFNDRSIQYQTHSEPRVTEPSDPADKQVTGFSGLFVDSRFTTEQLETRLLILPPTVSSPLCRIWDSLSLFHQETRFLFIPYNSVALRTDRGRPSYLLGRLDPSENACFTAAGTTDKDGFCRLTRLEPGLYFVKAQQGTLQSNIAMLTPANGGATIYLSDSARAQFFVGVAGITDSRLSRIAHCLLTVRGLGSGNNALFSGETDEYGMWELKNVPYGEYSLHLKTKDQTQSAQRTITMDEPAERFFIELEKVGFSIAGRVVDEKTQQPVPGHGLRLKYQVSQGNVLQKTISGSDGSFRFENMPAGTYCIDSEIQDTVADEEYWLSPKYAAAQVSFPPGGAGIQMKLFGRGSDELFIPRRTSGTGVVVQLVQQPIENLTYYVKRLKKTILAGQVTDSANTPMAGAEILLDNGNYRFLEDENRTDRNGMFHLSFFAQPLDYPFQTKLQAVLESPESDSPEARASLNGGFGYDNVSDPVGRAEKEITLLLGRKNDNIHLVMDTKEPKYTLSVELITPDGARHTDAQVYVFQKSVIRKAHCDQNGLYTVRLHAPDRYSIEVLQNESSQRPNAYCNEYVSQVISDEQTEYSIRIPMRLAGHLSGTLLDQTRRPLPGQTIWAIGENLSRVAHTDGNGGFYLEGIPVDISVRLETDTPDQGRAVLLQLIAATSDNITLQAPW